MNYHETEEQKWARRALEQKATYDAAIAKKRSPPPFMHEATSYLMDRNINIAHTSSLRKISRALRIAWGARTPVEKKPKGLRPGAFSIIRSKSPSR